MDIDALTNDELCDEVMTWAGRVAAGEAKLLALIGELDARDAWSAPGVLSCAHWLSFRCSMGPGAARERVRVARALRDLPLTTEAFQAGRLSWSQVRAITRVARPGTEQQYVEMARHSSAAQLERLARAVRRVERTEEAERDPEQAAYRMRSTVRYDEDGTVVMTLRMSAEQSQVVLAVLEQTQAQLQSPDVPAETSAAASIPASLADALVLLCSVTKQVDLDSKARQKLKVCLDPLSGWSRLADGELLAPGTLPEHLIPPALRSEGSVPRREELFSLLPRDALTRHDAGRERRDAPPALRALLGQVDGERCRFPGCSHTRFLHAHHILYWSRGGNTDLANLVLLCSRHHQYVHVNDVQLTLLADRRLVVRDTSGQLPWGDRPAFDITGLDQSDITATTLPPAWDGSHLDLDHAVWVLMQHAA